MALTRRLRLLSLTTRLLLDPRRNLAVRGPDEPLPVVRIPVALQRRKEQLQSRRRSCRTPVLVRPGPLLVLARRPEFNQPARLTLGRWECAPLASRGWRSRRARRDHFSIERAQRETPALRNVSSEERSFPDLGLEPRVLRSLQEAAPEVFRPTTVQSSTIPPLLRGRHILCAVETGSGKTLSYLLSLDSRRIPASRGLVLVSLGLQVQKLEGGHGMPDVLVATAGALWKALKGRLISLERLSFLVLDEADTLLDESFLELVDYILEKSHTAEGPTDLEDPFNPKAQLVLLLSKVASPDSLATITSSKLRCIMSHVRQTFMRLKGAEKVTELVQILKHHDKSDRTGPSVAVLVFCNSCSAMNWLQGQMPASMTAGVFRCFQKGSRDVLLCTDIAFPGLDSIHVELVINYDFPLTLQDYIHRAGRVSHVGSEVPGTVISFVTHPWDVSLVQKIELAARQRRSLPGLTSSVRELLPQQI
uniref:ATP-dependent RNA helicase n=1 Tax=Microcebus murinus TaxID=30608 RepID=A0A8C5XKG2_MICMU